MRRSLKFGVYQNKERATHHVVLKQFVKVHLSDDSVVDGVLFRTFNQLQEILTSVSAKTFRARFKWLGHYTSINSTKEVMREVLNKKQP